MEHHPLIESVLYGLGMALMGIWAKYRFVTKKECEHDQDKCSAHVCVKLDGIKADIRGDLQVLFTHMNENNVFMGRVLQFMKERESERTNGNRSEPT